MVLVETNVLVEVLIDAIEEVDLPDLEVLHELTVEMFEQSDVLGDSFLLEIDLRCFVDE